MIVNCSKHRDKYSIKGGFCSYRTRLFMFLDYRKNFVEGILIPSVYRHVNTNERVFLGTSHLYHLAPELTLGKLTG